MTKAKNFLVICADEHRPDALGCMGHPVVKTPNLDALAARGTMFTRAYTPSPICVSARAALACGDYVHNLGYWDSATPYDGARRSWMHVLRGGGVETASIGKLHFKSGEDDNGFSEEILPMHVVGGIGWAIGLLRGDRTPFEGGRELAAGVGVGPTRYTDYDRDIAAAAEDWIAARATGGEPWSAFVSFVSPHFPLTAPDEYFGLYDEDRLDWPVGYDEALGLRHPEIAALAAFYDYGPHFDAAGRAPRKSRLFRPGFFCRCLRGARSAGPRTDRSGRGYGRRLHVRPWRDAGRYGALDQDGDV